MRQRQLRHGCRKSTRSKRSVGEEVVSTGPGWRARLVLVWGEQVLQRWARVVLVWAERAEPVS